MTDGVIQLKKKNLAAVQSALEPLQHVLRDEFPYKEGYYDVHIKPSRVELKYGSNDLAFFKKIDETVYLICSYGNNYSKKVSNKLGDCINNFLNNYGKFGYLAESVKFTTDSKIDNAYVVDNGKKTWTIVCVDKGKGDSNE